MVNYQIEYITDSLDREADYLCYVAKELVEKQYQNNGYTVLPYIDPKNLFSVHFPDWPYTSKFWQTIGKSSRNNYGDSFPISCLGEIVGYLQKLVPHSANKKRYLKEWRKIEKKVMPLILGDVTHLTFTISVLVTEFGTGGAFYGKKNGNNVCIFCTARTDLPVTELIRTLVMAVYQTITETKGEIGSLPYYQWMAYADYSVAFTKISTVVKLKPRVFGHQAKVSLRTYSDSQAFLQKLGLVGKSELFLDGEVLKFGNTPLNMFTPQEKQLLGVFIKSTGKVISFDQAGEVIWGEDSDKKFSLYALAKLVENIRTKLRGVGMNTCPIKTIRKQGYLFTG